MFSLFVIQGDSLQGPPDAAMMTTFDIVRVDCCLVDCCLFDVLIVLLTFSCIDGCIHILCMLYAIYIPIHQHLNTSPPLPTSPNPLPSPLQVAILVGMPIYDRLLAPFLKRHLKWTVLRRIGTGYFIAAIAIAMGGALETVRLNSVYANGMTDMDPSTNPPPVSIWWQTPMYVFIGISEIFAMAGMYELFYVEVMDIHT